MDSLDADHLGAGNLDVGHSNLELDRRDSRNPFREADGYSLRRNDLPEGVPTLLRIKRMLRVTISNQASVKSRCAMAETAGDETGGTIGDEVSTPIRTGATPGLVHLLQLWPIGSIARVCLVPVVDSGGSQ